ncbi:hypothetical protein CHU93_02995 [Sandarakinorhabdus cyanobacteriorum]|uniref:Peptidase A2 domain-containing protein n=2 Tax=Sandarakinorhabdus cyanobacteriorum TaxID=1981098 RepID=A0A255YXS1_9SPHN|nr:hypothetical protein CHU93_02995 [Sandarakinorhabdus cyanobacteriorum]
MPVFRWAWAVLLIVLHAKATPGQAAEPPPFAVDRPIMASIKGRPVCLKLSTGSLDRVILSSTLALELGLRPEASTPALLVGGEPTRAMRRGFAMLGLFGPATRARLAWFPDAPPPPDCDGTIGPAWLPFWTVRVQLPGLGGRQWVWPLEHSIASASYALVPIADQTISVLMAVERDLRYPLASAATANLLMNSLGGRIVPETWDEDMIPGVQRPVRLLVLNRPLVIGPWRFDRVAFNVQTGRDRLSSARGPRPMNPAPADPDEMLVKAKIPAGPAPSYTLILPRSALLRCASLVYEKKLRKLRLDCADVAVQS